jgi:hypothetical protein
MGADACKHGNHRKRLYIALSHADAKRPGDSIVDSHSLFDELRTRMASANAWSASSPEQDLARLGLMIRRYLLFQLARALKSRGNTWRVREQPSLLELRKALALVSHKRSLNEDTTLVANSRHITSAGTFPAWEELALVDGNIGESAVAEKIVDTAIKRFGSVDALVNNAGIFFAKPFPAFSAADFEALSTVSLKGFLYVTQGSVKQMLAQNSGGSVVTITSSQVVNPDCWWTGFCTDDHEGWP